jgi:hypothetical protein
MSTIKQKSAFVQIEGGKRIEVRRMKWKAARAMLKMLSDVVTKLYAGDGLQSVVEADSLAKAAGAAQGFIPRLGVIVQQSDEILQHLATQSTDLTSEDFDALDIATASEVIAQAFAINFDTELKNSWGNVVGVVQALMLPKAKTS